MPICYIKPFWAVLFWTFSWKSIRLGNILSHKENTLSAMKTIRKKIQTHVSHDRKNQVLLPKELRKQRTKLLLKSSCNQKGQGTGYLIDQFHWNTSTRYVWCPSAEACTRTLLQGLHQ